MDVEIFLILSVIGIIVGILSGMFGIGGGVLIVPSLVMLYSYIGFDSPYLVHVAIATSLFIVVITSIFSSYRHHKLNNVVWSAALITGITGSVCVFWLSLIVLKLSGEVLSVIFSVILIIIAVKLLTENTGEARNNNNPGLQYNKWLCIPAGLIAGIISAFSGLGGGIFIIPILYYLLKFPFKKAIGTSSVAIIFTAFSGVISYYLNKPEDFIEGKYFLGMTDIKVAAPILLFSIPASFIGVHLNSITGNRLLSKLFAVLIFIIALKMILL